MNQNYADGKFTFPRKTMTFKLQAISHSAHFPEKYRKTWSSDEKCGNNLIGMWFNLIWVLIEYLVWGRLEEDPGVPTDYWTVHNLGNRRFEGFDKQKRNQLERSQFKPELWASLSPRHTQACNSTGSQSWRWTLCCLDPWDITSELVPDKSCVSTYDLRTLLSAEKVFVVESPGRPQQRSQNHLLDRST